MKNIVLIGMMGSGKTTCGRLLGEKLGRKFIDADDIIVERAGMSVSDIFDKLGEPAFRDMETQVARELGASSDLVIATGGGMPMRPENAEALRVNSVVFMLNRPVDEIFDAENLEDRPLARNGKQDFITRFLNREDRYLTAAHHVINHFETPEITVGEIMDIARFEGAIDAEI